MAVSAVAAAISYQHGYVSNGETGENALLLPFTMEGLI
jgi:hypothetical protein